MSCIHFCTAEPRKQKIKKTTKEFRSSFENISDFSGYYLAMSSLRVFYLAFSFYLS